MKAERAIQELRLLRDEARQTQVRRESPEHKSWRARTGAVLARSLGQDAGVVREFRELRYHVGVWTGAPGEAEADARFFAARVDDAAGLIEAAIYELGLLSDDTAPAGRRGLGPGSDVQLFVDDDSSYLQWLSEHPDAYVINTTRRPGPGYLVLHRARCRTISGPSSGSTFTGEYSKACGTRQELQAFAQDLGGDANPCGICIGRQTAQPASRSSRYTPLRNYLAALGGTDLQMTFADIEKLVGPLPESARLHRAWWSNSSATSPAWRDAGWRLQSVDQAARRVTFTRAGEPAHPRAQQPPRTQIQYVDVHLITAIQAADGTDRFSRAKLLRLIGELNDNCGKGNTYAAHALLRAILDHVPPLLNCPDFEAVASNYPWGRTDRKYMRRLLDFKLQADDVLHRQISARADMLTIDDMPARAWINRLLQECITKEPGRLENSARK